MNDDIGGQIRLERDPSSGATLLIGVNGEVEPTQAMVDAIIHDRELMSCVVLQIAHNRVEQMKPRVRHSIGQLVVEQIEIVQAEVFERL